jgi:hypothetical protein
MCHRGGGGAPGDRSGDGCMEGVGAGCGVASACVAAGYDVVSWSSPSG